MAEPTTIVFALYPQITPLDFTGPYEVLRRLPAARTIVASREGGKLTADSGLIYDGLTRLDTIERCDVICVVGGAGLARPVEQ